MWGNPNFLPFWSYLLLTTDLIWGDNQFLEVRRFTNREFASNKDKLHWKVDRKMVVIVDFQEKLWFNQLLLPKIAIQITHPQQQYRKTNHSNCRISNCYVVLNIGDVDCPGFSDFSVQLTSRLWKHTVTS